MLKEQERIDIVRYRLENAHKTLKEVDLLIQNGLFNTAANRMYYACFYAVSALLVANQITTKSHDGVKQMFGLHFIKTGIFPAYFGKYYGELFYERITGDYEDLFDHDEVSINGLYPKAKEIVDAVTALTNKWLEEQGSNQKTNKNTSNQANKTANE